MNKSRGHILLVDDDPVFSKVFGKELNSMGFRISQDFGTDILANLEKSNIDIVILDIVMPGINGLELLREIKKRYPSKDVIMLTGNATIENAVTSMKIGAYDYFTKPVELERVEQVLQRCLDARKLITKNEMLKNKLSDIQGGQLIGNSQAITEIKSLVSRFSDSNSTVLIYGESGTGKELIANLIHQNSPRRNEPFIIVDCTALKENLLESELFGHERGAFTGAISKKHGILEVADGGTVFLDEIGDISKSLQAKLLRVVETKSFRRLGGNERIVVDIRIIAATNRDLLDMVKNGDFREDLYYRINVINISIPPLREHLEDLPLLVDYFLSGINETNETKKIFSLEAMNILKEYHFPGNIRELKNVVDRSQLLSEDDIIGVNDIPLKSSVLNNILHMHFNDDEPSLQELEEAYIKWVLKKTKGNKQLAAKILKVDRKTISRKLNQRSNGE